MYAHCVYEQILITAKLQIGQRGQKTELTGRSPLRKRRSALDCSVIEGEEESPVGVLSFLQGLTLKNSPFCTHSVFIYSVWI